MKKYICGITLLLALALMTGCSNEKYNEDGVLDNTDTEIVEENENETENEGVNNQEEKTEEKEETKEENLPSKNDDVKVEEVKKLNAEEIYNAVIDNFASVGPIESDLIEAMIGVTPDMVDEAIVGYPMMNVKANMYLIFKPAEGKKDAVKQKVDEFMNNQEEQWSRYLPDQYELVKARVSSEKNGYLIYVIAEKANDVVKIIESKIE